VIEDLEHVLVSQNFWGMMHSFATRGRKSHHTALCDDDAPNSDCPPSHSAQFRLPSEPRHKIVFPGWVRSLFRGTRIAHPGSNYNGKCEHVTHFETSIRQVDCLDRFSQVLRCAVMCMLRLVSHQLQVILFASKFSSILA